MEKTRDFFMGLLMTFGGMIWSLGQDWSVVGCLAVFGSATALIWIPWQRLPWLRRVLMALSAGMTLFATVRLLRQTVCSYLPVWQIVTALILFTALFVYFGKQPLRRAALLIGGITAVSLIIGGILCLPMYGASLQLRADSLQGPLFSAVALLGAALTALEAAQDLQSARLGGTVGFLFYGLTAVTTLGVWSPGALTYLQYPTVSAWRRIDFFSVFSCPDTVLVASLAVCAVFQWSMAGLALFSLQTNRKNI